MRTHFFKATALGAALVACTLPPMVMAMAQAAQPAAAQAAQAVTAGAVVSMRPLSLAVRTMSPVRPSVPSSC